MNDQFEWDWKKHASNLIDHKIGFDQAKEIFKGPRLEWPDTREHYGEDRFISIGEVEGRCLFVVHTPRGGKTRIISARKATRNEQIAYYKKIYGEE
ncbi:MAG: BrnT family toxin [Proteobacteria bacterium]|nr:BrnT family toxin [Pseudomonadota bacterium]